MDTILSKGIAWATDIHLDFADVADFVLELKANPAKSIILTGDIASVPHIRHCLKELSAHKRVFFVLGNHDYYGGNVAWLREDLRKFPFANTSFLTLMTAPIEISQNEFLVGVDGWADARHGNMYSSVCLNDWQMIDEMWRARPTGGNIRAPIGAMRSLADADAERLGVLLGQCDGAKRVIVATHVPPFRNSSWHEGKPSDDNWAPFFTSKATGDEIFRFSRRNPKTEIVVLCGHSHGDGVWKHENITAYTGGAEYGDPKVQKLSF